jgi:hypothetical protein
LLATKQDQNKRLEQEKEDSVNVSQAAFESLRTGVDWLTSVKGDLCSQLRDKDIELADAKSEASHLKDVLERYRTQHIRSAEVLSDEVLELLAQCNLEAPPTSFPQCTVRSFYEWVNACFDLVAMNTKIFDELGSAVRVRTLAYSVCSLVLVDRPSSEKTVNKSDIRCLTKDDYRWPSDA